MRKRGDFARDSLIYKKNIKTEDFNEQLTSFKDYPKESYSKDYLFIEFKLEEKPIYFLIHKVPNEYGPDWSHNIGIEYRDEWGIPELKERQKISEIVSFIFGRQLIKIGQTIFDKKGCPLKKIALSPNLAPETNIITLCQVIDLTPIRLNQNSIETPLSKLIPEYLSLREDLNLHEALERYWISQLLPTEAGIIVIAAALELLKTSWYKSPNHSKIKGIYMPKKQYDDLLHADFNAIQEKLEEVYFGENTDFSERILKKIKNSYQMGGNEGLNFFFKDIGLPTGEIEKNAIISRNKPAHGHILKEKAVDELSEMTNAYRVLVNRTILKILGFEGDYVDYYSKNFPGRYIDTPIGQSKI